MIEKVLKWIVGKGIPVWRLGGYDTFADEWYSVSGWYLSERAAQRAAKKRLRYLERVQPSSSSGGQEERGIQDRVFIVRPDGTMYRYPPETVGTGR